MATKQGKLDYLGQYVEDRLSKINEGTAADAKQQELDAANGKIKFLEKLIEKKDKELKDTKHMLEKTREEGQSYKKQYEDLLSTWINCTKADMQPRFKASG